RKRYELQLQRTAEFRERFLGVVGHDLRNPLSAILVAAQMLERRELTPEQSRRAAHRILTSAQRMSQMIGELLDFTRGRLGGGIPVKRGPVDLSALCKEVLEEIQLTHPERPFDLQLPGPVLGSWDEVRLSQVVSNLLGNAVRYSPKKSPVRIQVRDLGKDA